MSEKKQGKNNDEKASESLFLKISVGKKAHSHSPYA
jgi:hypothetical protein